QRGAVSSGYVSRSRNLHRNPELPSFWRRWPVRWRTPAFWGRPTVRRGGPVRRRLVPVVIHCILFSLTGARGIAGGSNCLGDETLCLTNLQRTRHEFGEHGVTEDSKCARLRARSETPLHNCIDSRLGRLGYR